MTFESWLARLRDRGFVTCPASSGIPVDMRAVAHDGTGLHFRCRGVRIRLHVYRPGRAAWQTPLRDENWSPEESLELWENRPLRDTEIPAGGRLVFVAAGADPEPDTEIVLDGAETHGWRNHEAGLLPAAEAAAIFDTMLVAAGLTMTAGEAPRPPRPRQPHARPAALRPPGSHLLQPVDLATPAPDATIRPLRTYAALATATAGTARQTSRDSTGAAARR